MGELTLITVSVNGNAGLPIRLFRNQLIHARNFDEKKICRLTINENQIENSD